MLWYLTDKHLKNGEKCQFYSIFTAKNNIKWGQANLIICIDTYKYHFVIVSTISDESIGFCNKFVPKRAKKANFTVIYDFSKAFERD